MPSLPSPFSVDPSAVTAERDGAVLTVRVDNPPLNFLNAALMDRLADTLAAARRDPDVRAVVLTGATPGVFIGHYDIDEILDGVRRAGVALPERLAPVPLRVLAPLVRVPRLRAALAATPVGGLVSLLRFHEVIRSMRRSDTVFVAAIDGPALGGGFELALGCDIRVTGDGPYDLGQAELLLGLVPGGGGSQLLARMLGSARTIELLLEGRLFSPAEALEAGLVHHVVPRDEVVKHAHEVASRLATRSASAVGAAKRLVYEASSASVERGLAAERASFLALAGGAPAQRALGRYLDDIRAHLASGGGAADFSRTRLPRWQAGTATGFRG
ncbi:enoyl-CoA hydratase/isomerase family protein [Yinghuangia seranimata]|uniref:enoyl-CoA hydratase/isomerase family protein n=1 Tax=Yinghuangia seranimata TaxID=408067 RepID=UPI00248B04AA|nr:enoyl-CoA hydratase/isomerase family protein [Yinghuangia seranimata]MDI2127665.1 enoyl-CoA hydratase/isomerase family protein [Yinghuangia seranimata]